MLLLNALVHLLELRAVSHETLHYVQPYETLHAISLSISRSKTYLVLEGGSQPSPQALTENGCLLDFNMISIEYSLKFSNEKPFVF